MLGYRTEIMLHTYFLAEAVVGRFCGDKRALFGVFARIFLLPEEERERLFGLAMRDELQGLKSEQLYMQLRRLRQFFVMRGETKEEDPETVRLLDIKGSALSLAERYKLPLTESVQTVACENLLAAAEGGCVPFLVIVGALLCEGIVTGKDPARGLQNLRKAAEWNSIEGLFAGLAYDPDGRSRYLAPLSGLLKRLGHDETARRVEAVYGTADHGCERGYLLLEKAFAQGIVRRDVYSKAHARLIYSSAVDEKDKEAVILSPNQELFAEASALPLKLAFTDAPFDPSPILAVRPYLGRETEDVAARIENFDLRGIDGYCPVCLSSDSVYMTERYAAAVRRAFPTARIERIEVSDMSEYDLEPSQNNIFVRGCAEDRFNVYLMFFRGEIRERVFDAAKNFLKSAKRRRFRLIRPAVSIDLSPVLPVCFCDAEWEKRLEGLCDIVRVSSLSQEEKGWLPAEIFREKQAVYRADSVIMADVAPAVLSGYTADEIDKILDAAVREHRRTAFELTDDDVKKYYRLICEKHNTYYGFGGGYNGYHE